MYLCVCVTYIHGQCRILYIEINCNKTVFSLVIMHE